MTINSHDDSHDIYTHAEPGIPFLLPLINTLHFFFCFSIPLPAPYFFSEQRRQCDRYTPKYGTVRLPIFDIIHTLMSLALSTT
jgi:hypothetical protein